MNTDDTPLLPHGGYRKLRSYPDEIRRYEDRPQRNSLPSAPPNVARVSRPCSGPKRRIKENATVKEQRPAPDCSRQASRISGYIFCHRFRLSPPMVSPIMETGSWMLISRVPGKRKHDCIG